MGPRASIVWEGGEIEFMYVLSTFMGRDIPVGIATCYGLDGPEIECRWGARFSSPAQTYPVVHPASYTKGTGSFPGVKRPGRGIDHSPHLSAKLKKE